MVPCEWPTYDSVSTPVFPKMYNTLAGRSYAAISSHVKSQNAGVSGCARGRGNSKDESESESEGDRNTR